MSTLSTSAAFSTSTHKMSLCLSPTKKTFCRFVVLSLSDFCHLSPCHFPRKVDKRKHLLSTCRLVD